MLLYTRTMPGKNNYPEDARDRGSRSNKRIPPQERREHRGGNASMITTASAPRRALDKTRVGLRPLAVRLPATREEGWTQLARQIRHKLCGTLTPPKIDLSLLPAWLIYLAK